MKNTSISFLVGFLLLQTVLFSCKKKETDDVVVTPFEFTSLVASKTMAESNEEIIITATAKGDNLQYTWESPTATLLGSGSQITFIGSTCCAQENEVKCTIKDSHSHSDVKSVTIVLK